MADARVDPARDRAGRGEAVCPGADRVTPVARLLHLLRQGLAPARNQPSISMRSASLIWVRLPIGIALVTTVC